MLKAIEDVKARTLPHTSFTCLPLILLQIVQEMAKAASELPLQASITSQVHGALQTRKGLCTACLGSITRQTQHRCHYQSSKHGTTPVSTRSVYTTRENDNQ